MVLRSVSLCQMLPSVLVQQMKLLLRKLLYLHHSICFLDHLKVYYTRCHNTVRLSDYLLPVCKRNNICLFLLSDMHTSLEHRF